MNGDIVLTREPAETTSIPAIDLRHLRTLSDDTGILQHARWAVPDRDHGYCTDDVARALVVAVMATSVGRGDEVADLIPTYLSYLLHAWRPSSARFCNFMSFDRRWLEECGSEDSHGRALWGLGLTAARGAVASHREIALRMVREAALTPSSFTSPRAWAYSLLGLDHALEYDPLDPTVRQGVRELTSLLLERFACDDPEWPWCEEILTYDNAVLPLALLRGSVLMGERSGIERALRAIDWLFTNQVEEGSLSLVGNRGWMTKGGDRARFDQQPLDAASMLLAAAAALEVTGEELWRERCRIALDWYLGGNDTGMRLVDEETGGCHDGLEEHGVNANQGAESTLSWLIARLRFEEIRTAGPGARALGRSREKE